MELSYLRLVPGGRSLLTGVTKRPSTEVRSGLERVPASHLFYCGLQAKIWRKCHLQSLLLQKQQSVWEFERRCIPEAEHYSIIHSPPILYRHSVEHGRWLPDAPSLLRRTGLPTDLGDRPRWSKSRYGRLYLDRIRLITAGLFNLLIFT